MNEAQKKLPPRGSKKMNVAQIGHRVAVDFHRLAYRNMHGRKKVFPPILTLTEEQYRNLLVRRIGHLTMNLQALNLQAPKVEKAPDPILENFLIPLLCQFSSEAFAGKFETLVLLEKSPMGVSEAIEVRLHQLGFAYNVSAIRSNLNGRRGYLTYLRW